MTGVLLLPVVLSLLVLGAHFLRGGYLAVVAAVLVLIPLLAVRRRLVARMVQAVLTLGALEWVRTLFVLRARRSLLGQPAARMTLILGGVALSTALSALVFETRHLRRRYPRERRGAER